MRGRMANPTQALCAQHPRVRVPATHEPQKRIQLSSKPPGCVNGETSSSRGAW